jgi:hypothetical protein
VKFSVSLILLRVVAGAALLWLRLHPADWEPLAVYLLRGGCWVCLAASLGRRFVMLKNAVALRPTNTPWWRVLVKLSR